MEITLNENRFSNFLPKRLKVCSFWIQKEIPSFRKRLICGIVSMFTMLSLKIEAIIINCNGKSKIIHSIKFRFRH